MGSHSLFQGIFLTQELNLGLLHCRWILYHPSHQGSPQRQLTQYIISFLFFQRHRYSKMGTYSAQKQQEVKTSLKSLSDPLGDIRDLHRSYLPFTPGGWCRPASDRSPKAGLTLLPSVFSAEVLGMSPRDCTCEADLESGAEFTVGTAASTLGEMELKV